MCTNPEQRRCIAAYGIDSRSKDVAIPSVAVSPAYWAGRNVGNNLLGTLGPGALNNIRYRLSPTLRPMNAYGQRSSEAERGKG
jgi:hypothetical protein